MQAGPCLAPRKRLRGSGAKRDAAAANLLAPGVGDLRIRAGLEAFEQSEGKRRPFLGGESERLVQDVVNARIHGQSLAPASDSRHQCVSAWQVVGTQSSEPQRTALHQIADLASPPRNRTDFCPRDPKRPSSLYILRVPRQLPTAPETHYFDNAATVASRATDNVAATTKNCRSGAVPSA